MTATKAPLDRLRGEAPLDLTTTVRDISVTERAAFRDCRRRWFLETIENLEKRGVRQWNLDFGTGVHAGLEDFYKAFADIIPGEPIVVAHKAFQKWYEEQDAEIKKLGSLGDPLRDELLEYRDLGTGMLDLYNEFAVENDTYFEPLWIEGVPSPAVANYTSDSEPPYAKGARPFRHPSGRILVPIVHPVTKRRLSSQKGGSPPYLSARLDVILFRKEMGLRGFWIMDHKTTGSAPSDRGIDFEDQITGYCYVFWRLTGIIPRGTIFNYLVKQLPKPPRIVNDGRSLSYAKDQLTLPDMYERAMVEWGVTESIKHRECLAALRSLGWKRFFQRFEVQRNEHELMRFEERLFEEYHDMLEAYKNPARRAYPNQSTMRCPNCQVNRICQAIEDGSDYEYVIQSGYQQAKDRKAK